MSAADTAPAYRYAHFRTAHLLADLRFDPAGPAPGDPLPVLDLVTTDGQPLTREDLDRPHLFVFGSTTCPMTASAGDGLRDLHQQFGDQVRLVLVQVREAHPGEQTPQPATIAEKHEHARRLQSDLAIPFAVAVDDVDGSFHRSLDPKPNAAYLVDADATIQYRSLWASDIGELQAALDAVVGGRRPVRGQSTRMVGPLTVALGYVHDAVGRGGRQARRDLRRAAPPMAAAGHVAALLGCVRQDRRGPVVIGSLGALLLVAVVAVRRGPSRGRG